MLHLSLHRMLQVFIHTSSVLRSQSAAPAAPLQCTINQLPCLDRHDDELVYSLDCKVQITIKDFWIVLMCFLCTPILSNFMQIKFNLVMFGIPWLFSRVKCKYGVCWLSKPMRYVFGIFWCQCLKPLRMCLPRMCQFMALRVCLCVYLVRQGAVERTKTIQCIEYILPFWFLVCL